MNFDDAHSRSRKGAGVVITSSVTNQCYKYRRYIGNIAMLTHWRYIGNISPQYFPDFFWRFFPIFSRYLPILSRYLPIFGDICQFLAIFADFFKYTVIFFFFCIFYFADIFPMFADIFADKSDNFFLDPWRYIHRHDICNTGLNLVLK